VLQGEAIRSAIEAHRRNKPGCMGSLYWQLNDCWPVASWSSTDYYGRWKALQYYVKRSYQEVLLLAVQREKAVDVYVVSDKPDPVTLTVSAQVLDFAGRALKQVRGVLPPETLVTVPANGVQAVLTVDAQALSQEADLRSHLMRLQVTENGQVLDAKVHYFVPIKDLKLVTPHITVSETGKGDGGQFRLETDVLAKSVWIQAGEEGVFSDNWFDLVPGHSQLVDFRKPHPRGLYFAPAHPGRIQVQSMTDFVR